MYERFTDRAKKSLQLANQEAQRFNHEYIGTEHLLLGLVKEGSGIAANVLVDLEISLRDIRKEVENLVQSGPDMVTMGKLPHTPRCKHVLERAINAAKEIGHNYVGTEHILLGLIREVDGIAFQVLHSLGITEDKVTLQTHNRCGTTPKTKKLLSAKEVLLAAKEKAIHFKDFEKAAGFSQDLIDLKAAKKALNDEAIEAAAEKAKAAEVVAAMKNDFTSSSTTVISTVDQEQFTKTVKNLHRKVYFAVAGTLPSPDISIKDIEEGTNNCHRAALIEIVNALFKYVENGDAKQALESIFDVTEYALEEDPT